GRRVLQRGTGDLNRIGNAGSQQVFVVAGRGVEAVPSFETADVFGNDAAFIASVDSNLLQRRLDSNLDDVGTGGLVVFQGQGSKCLIASLHQRHAATCDDALFNSSLGVAHGIFDAVLAFLQLDLGRGTGTNDGNTTC